MYKEIVTASPIRAWYLRTFRGLSVRCVRCTPVLLPVFGMIVYSRYWVLATV